VPRAALKRANPNSDSAPVRRALPPRVLGPAPAPRVTHQARSRATRERLLEAAEAVVAAKGCEGAGVAEVAARAGCSVGACYTRFRDKRGLLLALQERLHEEGLRRLDAGLDAARWTGEPLPGCLQGAVRALVELHRCRRALLRAFAVEAQRDPALQMLRDRLFQHGGNRLVELLRGRAHEIGHHHPERAAAFGLAVVWSSVEAAVLFDRLRPGGLAPTEDDLVAELTRLLLAYLGVAANR
jgi:AcrR family transcriptional regulator